MLPAPAPDLLGLLTLLPPADLALSPPADLALLPPADLALTPPADLALSATFASALVVQLVPAPLEDLAAVLPPHLGAPPETLSVLLSLAMPLSLPSLSLAMIVLLYCLSCRVYHDLSPDRLSRELN